MKRALALLALAACWVDSGGAHSSFTPRHDAEARAAGRLMPAQLRTSRVPGSIVKLTARVWADSSYRRRAHWREHLQDLFERTNEYLRTSLGTELDVAIQTWEHDGQDEDLDELLRELVALDDGRGVDHVIGMTGGLPRVAMDQEQLGHAFTPGKHLVVRAISGALEHERLAAALPSLSRAELDEVSAARTAHKEVVVLLHEWAHNRGALHEDGPDFIMSPGYSPQASRFSEDNLAQMRAAAGAVPPPPPARGAADHTALARAEEQRAAGQLAEALRTLDAEERDGAPPGAWIDLGEAYLRLGAYRRAQAALARAGGAARAVELAAQARLMARQRGVFGVDAADEPEASAAIEEAHAAVAADDAARARSLTAAALARWPKLAGMWALRCGVEVSAGDLRAAAASCDRAVASGDESVLAHYYAGHVAARRGARAEAARHFERAIELDPGARPAYEALAEVYARDAAKLADLRRRFKERFGDELP